MPRNFATLGPSELQPPFTGGYSQSQLTFPFNLAALGRRQLQYIFLQICRNLCFYLFFSILDFVTTLKGYPIKVTPSPEVTESFCRVPSTQFSQTP